MAKKKNKKNGSNNLQLPEIGKKYHFFDDGKCSPSRHYIATVEEIITADEAKRRYFDSFMTNTMRPLYDIWKDNVSHSNFLYAEETDVFVRCSIPAYDENPIWFVRTKGGGLFSIDVQVGWQSGRLDLNGEMYQYAKSIFDNDGRHYDGYYDELSGTEKID